MIYYLPELDVRNGDEPVPAEKLGGEPEALPAGQRPHCRTCGGAMSLIAQLAHDGERLDLGRAGRWLYVFMCDHDPGMCETWAADGGGNACLVLEADNLEPAAEPSDSPAPAWNEAVIAAWSRADDGIDETLKPQFFDDAVFYGAGGDGEPSLAERMARVVPMDTKLGGVPHWLQGAEEGPAGCEFVGQIDSQMRFRTEPARVEPWMSPSEEGGYDADGPNFGDGGIAYLFADRSFDPPRVLMFWQCL